MTDILIKSFNRPYYLDRCLHSIDKYIKGKYNVKVLDDGTPEKYLNKIQKKYPHVKIIKSNNYTEKTKSINNNIATGEEINGFKIPTDLWIEAVKNATDYFIMTEDDVWFTKEINIDTLHLTMKKYKMALIKLGWISNRPIKSAFFKMPDTNISFIKPNIFTAPPKIMDFFFDNKFKLFSLLYRLKIVDNNTKNEYWVLNSLLMGFYSKKYWLKVWEKFDGKINETLQIKNAVQWYRKNRQNKYNFGKLDTLKMNTTFITSATNSYHKYGVPCDINVFNHIMNEYWLKGEFNSLESFPKDISEKYYTQFLDIENNPRCTSELWTKWASVFKEQYRKQGVDVD